MTKTTGKPLNTTRKSKKIITNVRRHRDGKEEGGGGGKHPENVFILLQFNILIFIKKKGVKGQFEVEPYLCS